LAGCRAVIDQGTMPRRDLLVLLAVIQQVHTVLVVLVGGGVDGQPNVPWRECSQEAVVSVVPDHHAHCAFRALILAQSRHLVLDEAAEQLVNSLAIGVLLNAGRHHLHCATELSLKPVVR